MTGRSDKMNWQERVIDEYNELSLRISKLAEFLDANKNIQSEIQGYNLMLIQLDAMKTYQSILYERIKLF